MKSQSFMLFYAQGFGSGKSPWAPGTVGTLMAMLLYWPLHLLPTLVYWLVVIGSFIVALKAVAVAQSFLDQEDDPSIVIDEIVAYWLLMGLIDHGIVPMLIAFVLFRFFDIIKPWPIGALERRIKGPLGVMLDDLLAAVAASAIYYLMSALGAF